MAILDFEEVLFPPKIDFGALGGPQFVTSITTTTGGFEQRQQNWEFSRSAYRSRHSLQDQTEMDELLAFFYAMRGQLIAFRFRDWMDYGSDMPGLITNGIRTSDGFVSLPAAGTLTATTIGSGTGALTDFQLLKRYTQPGAGDDYVRTIRKPVSTGTPMANDPNAEVIVYVDAAEQTEGAGNDYVIDTTTGIITFLAAPANGTVISADFLFDVPCRFASDLFEASKDAFNVDNWDGIQLVEVR